MEQVVANAAQSRKQVKWLPSLARRGGLTFIYLLLILLAFSMIFPYLWMLANSFKTRTGFYTNPYSVIPMPPTLSTYGDALTIRFFRFNLMKGHETAGAPLTPADSEAIDVLESVYRREELAVSFPMERGDMQFVNNKFVLHSRTAFEDHAEPERRRDFLRLWMRYRR